MLLVLLSLLLAYVGYYGVGFTGVEDLRQESAKLRLERDRLQQDRDDAQRLVANLDRIRKEREALEAQLKELSRRLPSEHESAEVLRNVELLARQGNMAVSQVKRRPTRPQEMYVELPLEVGLSGGFNDVIRFADQLSQLPRLVTLNEFKVQARPPAGQGGQGGAAPATDLAPGAVTAQLVPVVYQALPVPTGVPPPAPKP
jgi:type IV pilus assembly protein PilO